MMKILLRLLAVGLIAYGGNANAEPFAECPIEAFLIQDTVAKAYGVRLGTGYYQQLASDLNTDNRLNGVGFSVHDAYLYGWNYATRSPGRMGSDFRIEALEATGLPNSDFYVGDVSVNDNAYFVYRPGSAFGLYRINLDMPAPLAAEQVIDGGSLNLRIFDFAFHPADGFAYAVDRNGLLWQINVSNGDATSLGNVGASGTFGAAYFDVNGTMYVSRNTDGHIYRIDVSTSQPNAELFALGPASSNNDGARCALASITSEATSNIDFGDAPASYGTYLQDNGARHDQTNNSLFLGAAVDAEADAWLFPQSDDHSTSSSDVDDEDGVAFVTGLELGQNAILNINASEHGFVNVWIDLDNDGRFGDEENLLDGYAVDAGDNPVAVYIPLWAETGDTWARVRLSSEEILPPTGGAADGEVEDYSVTVTSADLEVVHYPSQNGWSTLAFEDTWPYQGDYDMNDVVVHQRITHYRSKADGSLFGVRIQGQIAALGASYHNGFGIRLPGVQRINVGEANVRFEKNFGGSGTPLEPNRTEAIVIVAEDLWAHISAGEGCEFYRTSSDCGGPAQMVYDIYLPLTGVTPSATEGLALGLDPFIFATPGAVRPGVFGGIPGRGLEIHLKNQPPTEAFDISFLGKNDDASTTEEYFLTEHGMPWALEISERWAHPLSGIDLVDAYPSFIDFVQSNGAEETGWYSADKAIIENTFVE